MYFGLFIVVYELSIELENYRGTPKFFMCEVRCVIRLVVRPKFYSRFFLWDLRSFPSPKILKSQLEKL